MAENEVVTMADYAESLKNLFTQRTPAEWAEHDREVERLEQQQKAAERFERFKKSGVPERYLNVSFESYRVENDGQKKANAYARAFLQAIKCGVFKSLVLLGNAGVGKTHLACSIIREVGGKYRTAPEIVEEIRRAKSFNAKETEADLIDYYGHVSLLVIDEIGRGINATDEKYMLYQLLNARYNAYKPTVLISNHTKADFLQYVGVAAVDRLVESADIAEIAGESYRRELRGVS